MIESQLLKHEWKLLTRSFVWRRHWAVTIFLVLLVVYVVFSLLTLGFLWRELVWIVDRGADPVDMLNEHLVTVFLALLMLRFFFQRRPRMRMRAYLHLPISRRRLVTFFQLQSLATVHNIFPFLFFLPLWARLILGETYAVGAWTWLAGIVLLLLLSHYLNTLLRSLVSRSREGLFIVLGVLMVAVFADLAAGPGVLNQVSAFIFDTLIQEQPVILLLLGMLVSTVFASSSLLLHRDLVNREENPRAARVALWQIPFRNPAHRLFNLILLELKLMWRCERPKLYFLISVVFGTLYLAVPLIDADLFGHTLLRALAALFASGIFAFNYGQLMFSWESSYFDGLLARKIELRDIVLAKLLLLQGSCVLFFLLSVPLFLLLAPSLLPLHLAFLFYNAGISTVLILLLALFNRRRVELKSVAFFDFEGFSLLHWIWYIPTVLPAILPLLLYPAEDVLPLLIIAGAGLGSLLLSRWWAEIFARRLAQRRYAMAASFRRLT